jgi:hypothetical protein
MTGWPGTLAGFASNVIVAVIVAIITVRLALKRFYREKWWERKSAAYISLIEALHHVRDYADTHYTFALLRQDLPEDGAEKLREKMKEGLSELRKQRDIGDLILSPPAVLLVTTLLEELDDSARAGYWQEHLELRLVAIDKCLLQMRLVARGDLGVD